MSNPESKSPDNDAVLEPRMRPRWVIPLVVLVIAGGIVGWAVMEHVAPRMIESASQGTSSVDAINHYFKPKGEAGVAKWTNRVEKLASTLLVTSIVFAVVTLLATGRWFERKLAGVATPGELGATRFLVCGILLWSAIWEDLASTSMLPREFIRSMGTMNFVRKIPGFDQFLTNHAALSAFEWLTCIALLLGMIGLWSRITVPLATICYFIFAGIMRQYTWFWHVGLIPVFVMFALSVMPSGDGFSIDRLRRVAKGKPVVQRDLATQFYGWCIYICWLPVCLAYLWAGLSKIAYGGWNWWRADNLRGIVVQDSLQPMEFDTRIGQNLAHAPAFFFAAMGIGAILSELSGILPVLASRQSRIGKHIRWIVPLMLAGVHVGIWVMQNILFFDLILIQAMFIDWRALRKWMGSKLNARAANVASAPREYTRDDPSSLHSNPGHLAILTPDAVSPRWRHILESLDLFERLEWTPTSATSGRDQLPELRVAYRGQEMSGDAALRAIARVIPALWLFLPLLWMKSFATSLRSRFADRVSMPVRQTIVHAPQGVWVKVAICLFVTFWTSVWFNRIEFYPLTSVQMYTKTDREMGVIYYTRVLAHYADGRTGRAYLEDGIGALADGRYRRVIDFALSKAPKDEAIADRVLKTCAREMNRDARTPAETITKFEVQRVVWHFNRDPNDSNKGKVTHRYFTDVAPKAPVARG